MYSSILFFRVDAMHDFSLYTNVQLRPRVRSRRVRSFLHSAATGVHLLSVALDRRCPEEAALAQLLLQAASA